MASRMSNRDRIQQKADEAEATRKAKATAKPKKKATTRKKATKKAVTKKAASKKKAAPKKAVSKKKAAPKKAAAKKPATRRKAAKKGRVKIVWAVCVPAGKPLKIFPYREKAEAEAEAKKLTEKKGTLHVIRGDRQPMSDDE